MGCFNRPITYPALFPMPAAYDDSLSYYEVVCSLADKVKEIIDAFNSIEFDDFATREELEAAIEDLRASLLDVLYQSQAEQTVMLKAHALAKIAEAVDYLQRQIDNVTISDVMMIDPERSESRSTVQDVAYNANQNYRYTADCAHNFDLLSYTAAIRDGMDLDAYRFDFFSSFDYSNGSLPTDGYYDGNFVLAIVRAFIDGNTGGGSDVDEKKFVKKHDIQAYYFERLNNA